MSSPGHILLVEDNADDAELCMRAFARQPVPRDVHLFNDGIALLEHLRHDPAGAAPPGLVLLDLKMPRLDGIATLAALRTMPRLSRVPVVIISSSGQHSDIEAAYAAGANSYIRKPVDYDAFGDALAAIVHYWLDLNLPAVPRMPG